MYVSICTGFVSLLVEPFYKWKLFPSSPVKMLSEEGSVRLRARQAGNGARGHTVSGLSTNGEVQWGVIDPCG